MKKLLAVALTLAMLFCSSVVGMAEGVVGKRVNSDSAAAASSSSSASNNSTPSVTLSKTPVDPGEAIKITLSGVRDIKTYSVDNDFDFTVTLSKLGDKPGEYFGFLPVSYHTTKGTYGVTVRSTELSGGKTVFSVPVSAKAFQEQWLTVDKEVADATINSDEASKEFRKVIWPLKETYDHNRYFDGPLVMPTTGRLTTQYGMIRYVNGAPSYRHDGIDLANSTGTPIAAAQNGKVIYSGFVTLTGNTIVIEHGLGLKTWYEHMDTRTVKTGDMVKTGQNIGTIGATGFVTGPHLHFSASINGVYINPYTLADTDYLKF